MRFRTRGDPWGEWLSFRSTHDLQTLNFGGLLHWQLQFRDHYYGDSPVFEIPVYLDWTIPGSGSNAVYINQFGTHTHSASVIVSISEFVPPQDVRLSNRADLADANWQTYGSRIPWRLNESGPDGPRTVFVQTRRADATIGNYQASIYLDRTPPSGSITLTRDIRGEDQSFTVVTVSATDNVGVTGMRAWPERPRIPSAFSSPAASFEVLEWFPTLRVEVVDAAGNISCLAPAGESCPPATYSCASSMTLPEAATFSTWINQTFLPVLMRTCYGGW
jgi:hypothetical protein